MEDINNTSQPNFFGYSKELSLRQIFQFYFKYVLFTKSFGGMKIHLKLASDMTFQILYQIRLLTRLEIREYHLENRLLADKSHDISSHNFSQNEDRYHKICCLK